MGGGAELCAACGGGWSLLLLVSGRQRSNWAICNLDPNLNINYGEVDNPLIQDLQNILPDIYIYIWK
jgi:hypothetical protein